jgi:predicted N-acetyltransferase YhbS
MEKMCKNANLIITARLAGRLIGVSRALTDYAYCTYLSDLAVDIDYQRKGIGRKLIIETKKHSPQAKLILLAAPGAIEYYPKIGMSQYEYSFLLKNIEDIK